MNIQRIALILIFMWMSTTAALARDKFITVTFKPDTQARLIQAIGEHYKLDSTQVKEHTYRFQIPPLRQVEQYSEFFASLSFVSATDPAPVYRVADHINPQVVNVQPQAPQVAQRGEQYLPGEFLVKFKPGTTAADIQFLNSHHNIHQISRISGIDVYRLRLPQGLSVEEAVKIYNQSGIVEYAEPNFRVKLVDPAPASTDATAADNSTPTANAQGNWPSGTAAVTQIPMDGGGQMLISFRPGVTEAQRKLFHQIYGTRSVKKVSFYQERIQMPAGMNAGRAVRIYQLYPYVTHVQRLYS